ncbi:hypothetical protein HPB50_022746 [Hyalomma asiaticum]|uniref:Uncharacterized protein n=1 Tax=Hyalomma asiaticum TaxID=266040 RepID=A0ACB7RQ13_HYAAI|nr:hypothetical protein HPB50_022746 [Hyalomma asiaticum]
MSAESQVQAQWPFTKVGPTPVCQLPQRLGRFLKGAVMRRGDGGPPAFSGRAPTKSMKDGGNAPPTWADSKRLLRGRWHSWTSEECINYRSPIDAAALRAGERGHKSRMPAVRSFSISGGTESFPAEVRTRSEVHFEKSCSDRALLRAGREEAAAVQSLPRFDWTYNRRFTPLHPCSTGIGEALPVSTKITSTDSHEADREMKCTDLLNTVHGGSQQKRKNWSSAISQSFLNGKKGLPLNLGKQEDRDRDRVPDNRAIRGPGQDPGRVTPSLFCPNRRELHWLNVSRQPQPHNRRALQTCGKLFQRATPRAFVWFAARPESSEETLASLSPRFQPCATEPSDESYVAPSARQFHVLSSLANRTTEFIWQRTLPHLRALIPKKSGTSGNFIHTFADVTLPDFARRVLSMGLVTYVRQVSRLADGADAESPSSSCTFAPAKGPALGKERGFFWGGVGGGERSSPDSGATAGLRNELIRRARDNHGHRSPPA